MGDCERDVKTIFSGFPKIEGLEVAEPVEGNAFNFNSLKDCKLLIVCTSSQYGMPPPNIKEFTHQLLLAAESNPGCLSHLQHAVYGNGDETYFKTYMDMLLEKCGSKRFFARGETGEPHAPLDTEKCTCLEWSPAMWSAAAEALKEGPQAKPVAWDALWAKQASEHHHKVTQWDLKKLEKKMSGKTPAKPSIFSKL